MKAPDVHVVTGGLGYSGQYIVQRLLANGATVRTITNSPHRRNPFGDRLEILPMTFDDPAALARSLEGGRSSTTPTGSGSTAAGSGTPPRSRTPSASSRPRAAPA